MALAATHERPRPSSRQQSLEHLFGTRFVLPLALGAILNPINSTMIATALVPIANDFHASVGQAKGPVSSPLCADTMEVSRYTQRSVYALEPARDERKHMIRYQVNHYRVVCRAGFVPRRNSAVFEVNQVLGSGRTLVPRVARREQRLGGIANALGGLRPVGRAAADHCRIGACVWALYRHQPSRPLCFAVYIAASACWMSSSASKQLSGKTLIPMLHEIATRCPPSSSGARTAVRTRSARRPPGTSPRKPTRTHRRRSGSRCRRCAGRN
jgi:hypothetical protein